MLKASVVWPGNDASMKSQMKVSKSKPGLLLYITSTGRAERAKHIRSYTCRAVLQLLSQILAGVSWYLCTGYFRRKSPR